MLNEGGRTIFNCSSFAGSSKSIFIADLFESISQIVVIVPTTYEAQELYVELNVLGLNEIILFTDFENEFKQEKIIEIKRKEKFVLISTYELFTLKLPFEKEIEQNITRITAGGDLNYDDLLEYLNLLHYTKDKFVEMPGDYSVRGSIIDFWSYSEKMPVRIEFDVNFIESMRYFDPDNQRSTQQIDEVTLAGKMDEGEKKDTYTNIFSYLTNPLVICNQFEIEKTILSKRTVDDLTDTSSLLDDDISISYKNDNVIKQEEIFSEFKNARWLIERELALGTEITELGFSEVPSINSNYKQLEEMLFRYSDCGYNIFITTENELQTKRMKELLSDLNDILSTFIDDGKIQVITLAINKGFINKTENILVLTDYQIFNKPYRKKLPSQKKIKRNRNRELAAIKNGEYVVHEDYGIGKYIGLETIKIGEAEQESMKLLYAQGDVVYVNLNYLHLVKKYSSKEGFTPTLATIGSAEWINTKRRAKKKIKEAARELIVLYAKRKSASGFSFSEDTVWQKELEASFIYEDTIDQSKATEDVKTDMQATHPMDRLVCGDVGFGKTEVAVRAAFKAVQDGKQVAVLVPTTILAEQHFNTFSDRLSQFPVKIAMLSRFQSKAKQKEIIDELENGKIDIVIGTHRLLSKDVKFKDIGLLVIDEEHRFGVMAKERLRSYKVNVDTLTLTATPIPRTLNLSLLGARDLSIIATPPPNRQPIYTMVETFDIYKIKNWINNELGRNGQVYFVHDRIQSIDKIASYLLKYMPELKIGTAHGQMSASQLENVIHGFLNRKYDVLLSTKIIESGIDIPNVNTIIVNRADRFGLSELHQLRGRVGRSDKQAYAYMLVPSLDAMNKKAIKRLQAIEEFTDLGEGFNISMRDLEIRGAGNLLGVEQTGFIDDIGFELYIKLINEAVEELKYEEFKDVFENFPKPKEKTDPTIDTFFEIGIPVNYMPEQMDRLSFYTELYAIKSLEELDEIKEELKDRYGGFPILVQRLMQVARLKYYAAKALFERIIIQRKNIFIILPRGEKEDYYKTKFLELMRFILDEYKNEVKFQQAKDVMKLSIQNKFDTPESSLDFLISFCKQIIKLFKNE